MHTFITLPILLIFLPSIIKAKRKEEFDDFVPDDYNEHTSSDKLSELTVVFVDVYIVKLVEISTKAMELSAEIHFAAAWTDKRLLHDKIASESMIIPTNIASKMWYPRLDFPDCKGCDGTIVNPQQHDFLYVKNKEQIQIPLRQSRQFSCPFDLAKYPFDTQICSIKFHLYMLNKDNVTLKSTENITAFLSKKITLPPEFQLVDVKIEEYYIPHEHINTICLSYNLKISRIHARYICLIFIPSCLIVVISWIAFWLEASAFGVRISLGLTLLLTLITHFNTAQRDLPVVATMTAVDIWMFYCLFSVFSLLLMVALSYCYHITTDTNKVTPVLVIEENQPRPKKNKTVKKSAPTHEIIDLASKVIFPTTFIVFNILFWFYYFALD